MNRSSILSERWFKFVDTISTVISSFIFSWVAAVICYSLINDKAVHYIDHLSKQTGNDALSAIGLLVEFVGYLVSYTLFMTPFSLIVSLILGNKISSKKQFILRFPLAVLIVLILSPIIILLSPIIMSFKRKR